METLRRNKYALLLAVLVTALLVQSTSRTLLLSPIVADLLLTASVLMVFLVVFVQRTHRMVALFAAITTIGVDWAHYVVPGELHDRWLAVIYHAALLLLFGYATVVILRHIFRQQQVGTDDVLGAVCGYFLAAGAWANLHALTEIFLPGSYNLVAGFDADLETWHGRVALFDYVSLGTLSSVGTGGIAPVRAPATVFVTLETIFGQFYLAVVVAQLVGARMAAASRNGGNTQ
jgi:hypothetical protein